MHLPFSRCKKTVNQRRQVKHAAMKYLPITVDDKTQKGSSSNHVIKCGRKFFDVIPLDVAVTSTPRSRKPRRPIS